jgi:hemolysin activation/secretion protein
MGVQTSLQLGRALTSFGSTRDAWLYNASLSNGFDVTKNSFLLANINAGGRYAEEGENQSVGGSVRYYHRHGRHLVYYAGLAADAVDNPDIPGPLLIGGDNGLRGYPLRYQAGKTNALLTLEERFYSSWQPLKLFNVGGAVFFDAGRAWGQDEYAAAPAGWLSDVGVGLRLGSPRSGLGNVLHIDLAMPLNRPNDIDSLQLLIETRKSF